MRIFVIGSPGSGKSTLARQLGEKYNTPVAYLDEMCWRDGWVKNENFLREREEVILGPEWIIDGGGPKAIETGKDQVDYIIILQYSTLGNIYRVLLRTIKCRLGLEKRIGLSIRGANRFNPKFFKYILDWPKGELIKIREVIDKYKLSDKLIEVRSPKEAMKVVTTLIKEK